MYKKFSVLNLNEAAALPQINFILRKSSKPRLPGSFLLFGILFSLIYLLFAAESDISYCGFQL